MAYVELKNSKTNEVIYTSSILKGHLIEDYLRSTLTDSSNIEIKILEQKVISFMPLEEALEYIENNWVDKTKVQKLCWLVPLRHSLLNEIKIAGKIIALKSHFNERFGLKQEWETLTDLYNAIHGESDGMLHLEYLNNVERLYLKVVSSERLKKFKIQKEDGGIRIEAIKVL